MGDKATLGVHIDKDSELYQDFEEYKQRGGFASTSEALRGLMREKFTEPDNKRSGPLAAVMSVAGEELGLQFRSLGWYLLFTGAFLFAFQTGLIGGVLWLLPAALFGFLSFVTAVFGIGAGLVDQLDPEPTPTTDNSSSADEVEQ
jgi:hypothetical protein